MTAMRVVASPAFLNEKWNPYNALLYRHLQKLGVHVDEFFSTRILFGRYDVWHIHWPDTVMTYGPTMSRLTERGFRLLVSRARQKGIAIVWTVHNVRTHDQRYPERERTFMHWFAENVDGLISLSHAGLDLVQNHYPVLKDVPSTVVRHGHYRDAYPKASSKAEARSALNLQAGHDVILFIGQVRPYKGVEDLVAAFRSVPSPNARLIIAGRIRSPELRMRLEGEAGADSRIVLMDGYVPVEQVATLCSAADVVILPYRDVLNSGSALLALSYNRPVVVPRVGAMQELQDDVGHSWVRTFRGRLDASFIVDTLNWAKSPRARSEYPTLPEWGDIAKETLAFYRALKAGPARQAPVVKRAAVGGGGR